MFGFFPKKARSHWLLWGHMTFHTETVLSPKDPEWAKLQNLRRQRKKVRCHLRIG